MKPGYCTFFFSSLFSYFSPKCLALFFKFFLLCNFILRVKKFWQDLVCSFFSSEKSPTFTGVCILFILTVYIFFLHPINSDLDQLLNENTLTLSLYNLDQIPDKTTLTLCTLKQIYAISSLPFEAITSELLLKCTNTANTPMHTDTHPPRKRENCRVEK